MIILTDGRTDLHAAKTAICVIRYRPSEVVALLDRKSAGRTCGAVLGVGGAIPVVASLADAPEANTLLIGIAPPGGRIPEHWRPIVLEAIGRGLNVVSGLHDFLSDNAEFARAAAERGVELVDLRRSDERDVASGEPFRQGCLRIHTIANDCSCGKMVTAMEVVEGLKRAGLDARFAATGQTGIMVAGSGCAVDRVISDFVSGTAEKLVRADEDGDVVVVEGQGSLFHPRYSGVTLGLLHGVKPDAMIYCYEMGRTAIFDMGVPLPPHRAVIEFYEAAAAVMHPCRVIGIAVNGQRFTADEVAAECQRTEQELGLPTCDVIRDGSEKLVEAVMELRK